MICEYRGKMFKCGSGLTDKQRANPPNIGSMITFGYFEIGSTGVPRFPTFKRIFRGNSTTKDQKTEMRGGDEADNADTGTHE